MHTAPVACTVIVGEHMACSNSKVVHALSEEAWVVAGAGVMRRSWGRRGRRYWGLGWIKAFNAAVRAVTASLKRNLAGENGLVC